MEQRKAILRLLLKRKRKVDKSRNDCRVYDQIEDVWLDAVQVYQEVNNVRFLCHTDYLWIAFQLGMNHFDSTHEGLLKRVMQR